MTTKQKKPSTRNATRAYAMKLGVRAGMTMEEGLVCSEHGNGEWPIRHVCKSWCEPCEGYWLKSSDLAQAIYDLPKELRDLANDVRVRVFAWNQRAWHRRPCEWNMEQLRVERLALRRMIEIAAEQPSDQRTYTLTLRRESAQFLIARIRREAEAREAAAEQMLRQFVLDGIEDRDDDLRAQGERC